MILFCPFAYSKVIQINDDGQADFDNIQAGIDASVDGDTILVAPGTYTGEGNRDIDFKGKAITVKSEDGSQACIIDCNGSEDDFHRGFYFHTNEDANSIVQGFTIVNGFVGDGGAIFCERSSPTICECIIRSNTAQVQYGMDYEGSGGGIYCNYSEALIKDCIIIDNSANPRWLQVPQGGRGGGVYCSNSNLTITGCEISNNSSALDQSGAVYCWTSNITINICISNDNQSNGIYMHKGNLEITDSLISNNKCSGIIYYSEGNEAIVKNCDILKNCWDGLNFYNIEDIIIERCLITANKHAGIFERGTNRLTVNNCTITNNRMRGIYCGAIDCKISNSIIWENRILLSPSSIVDNPLCTISYSNVQGALESVGIVEGYSLNWGEGNINLDPNFVSPGHWDPNGIPWTYKDDIWIDGDYHLKSQAGRWDPASQSWVQDDVTSPCIDAGDPNSPIGHELFPNGGIINMGAYGGTVEASKSLNETSIYIFWPQQSMVIQTGGIAGVDGTYILSGQFQLTIDFGAGKARFSNVEAIATDHSEPVRKLDPNDFFNLTGLTGTISRDGSIQFTGRTADESNVLLYITLSDEWISLKGQTTPPPNSADFFIFDLDAVAQRKYGGGTGELNDPYHRRRAQRLEQAL